jgi:GrpB protein
MAVVEYEAAWPLRFEQLRREYAGAMADSGVPVGIEHVGSWAGGEAGDRLRHRGRRAGYDRGFGGLGRARDILRVDPEFRDEYAAVKRRASASVANIDEYGQGKNTLIRRILAAAGLTEAEWASIDANQVPSHDESVAMKSGRRPCGL